MEERPNMATSRLVNPGDTVFTETDGLGIVESVHGDPPSEAFIRFDSGVSKRVILPNASLMMPSQQGFLVSASREPDRVRRLLHSHPDDVIVMLLQDATDQSLETIEIKERLVPKWVKEEEWPQWWATARKMLKKRRDIDTAQAKRQRYVLATVATSREAELLKLLKDRSLSSADRLVYLREMLALSRSSARSVEIKDEIRNQLNKLSRLETSEPWVRIMALLHLQEQGWITNEELQTRLHTLIDVPVRWRPVGKIEQFQAAQSMLLRSTEVGAIPAAVWSGLLARPPLAEWLLWQLLEQRNGSEITAALCEAISSVYPPALEPIKAAPDWAIDFVNVVQKARCDWEQGVFARQIDWGQVCDAILTAVCRARPQHLKKKGYVSAALSLISSAIAWHPASDPHDKASWLAEWASDGIRAPHLPGMIIEALLADHNADLLDAFLEQMAKRLDPAFADLSRIALKKSQEAREPQVTVEMLARIVRACYGSMRDYPETAKLILRHASDLVTLAKPEQLVLLLQTVQAALSASVEPSEASLAVEHRVWRRILDAALDGVLRPSPESVALSEVFIQELKAVAQRYQELLAGELQAMQTRVSEITQELDAARLRLAEAEQRREEALRSYAQSKATSGSVADSRRLIAEVAQVLAETDRVATTQQLRAEAAAQLLQVRLGRLLKQQRITRFGVLGERTQFDAKRHEVIEGTLGPRQIVEVIEVGYEQLTENGETVTVKTALVRATGE